MRQLSFPKMGYGGSVFDAATRGLQQGQKEYDRNTIFELGDRAIKGDWEGAQNTALERGNFNAAMAVQGYRDGREDRQTKAEDRTFAQQDRLEARGDRDEARKARRAELTRKLSLEAAGLFQNFVDREQDPNKRVVMTRQFIASHPDLSRRLQTYNVDMNDPAAVSQFFQAQARGYVDPQPPAQAKPTDDIREYQFAQQQGFDGSFEQWMARPKSSSQTLSATDRKAILEADEMIAANESVLGSIDQALEINDKAWYGPAAKTRAEYSSYAGMGGEETLDLDNIVTGQALEGLKAIFGGMPTEGERKILLEVSGSVNQKPDVRKQIYERAKAAAQRRLEFNRDRAAALRGGTYYQPQQEQPPSTEPPPSPNNGWSLQRIP